MDAWMDAHGVLAKEERRGEERGKERGHVQPQMHRKRLMKKS